MWKILCIATLLAAGFQSGAGEEKKMPPPPPRGERFNPGPAMWRAFSELDETERQKLIALQRTDQEAFRQKMYELGEAFQKRERERIEELKKLIAEYRSAGDETRKKELKEEIARRVADHYRKRLHENRRQLEEMKKRAMQMEAELDKREKQADSIIKARTDALLDGSQEIVFPRRKKGGRP